MKQQILWWSGAALIAVAACTPRAPGSATDAGVDDNDAGVDASVDFDGLVAEDPFVETAVVASPDGTHVAVGSPPAVLVRLTDGETVPVFDGRWRQAYLASRNEHVLLWDAATDDIHDLGTATAMQQNETQVWIERGIFGPFMVIDKDTLVETVVADAASNLVVTPTSTTLVIDGVTTIIWPEHVALDPAFTTVSVGVSPRRLFVQTVSRFLATPIRSDVIERATGVTTTFGVDKAVMTRAGTVAWHASASVAVLALDVDGHQRTLCASTSSTSSFSLVAVACAFSGTTVLVDIDSGIERAHARDASGSSLPSILPTDSRAYASLGAATAQIVFDDRTFTVARDRRDTITFNAAGTAAVVIRASGVEVVSANVPSTYLHEAPGSKAVVLDTVAVITDVSLTATVVSLSDLSTIATDAVVQSMSSSTGELFTIEMPAGETRPVLRMYKDGQPRVEVHTGVDRLRHVGHETAIVTIDEPANLAGRNGTWAFHVGE